MVRVEKVIIKNMVTISSGLNTNYVVKSVIALLICYSVIHQTMNHGSFARLYHFESLHNQQPTPLSKCLLIPSTHTHHSCSASRHRRNRCRPINITTSRHRSAITTASCAALTLTRRRARWTTRSTRRPNRRHCTALRPRWPRRPVVASWTRPHRAPAAVRTAVSTAAT